MNISVMIPSRGASKKVSSTIQNLIEMADKPELIEFICRIDEDDPDLSGYNALEFKNLKVLVGPRLGYRKIHEYYEDCYKESTGKLLLAYNDDVTVKTKGWDTAYITALANIANGVASCHMDEPGLGAYEWAMPMVKRELCDKMKCFCPGTETCDRVFDAYARMSNNYTRANVKMVHTWEAPPEGSEKDLTYKHVRGNWSEMTKKWNADAEKVVLASLSIYEVFH